MCLGRVRYSRKASILLIALWTICVLSTFAVYIGYAVRQKISLVRRLDAKDKLRLMAEAGVEKALCQLKSEAAKGYDSLQDVWSNNKASFSGIGIGEGTCDIGLVDEERKINVNRADMQTLIRLFKAALEYDPIEAQELAACIIDWHDTDSALSIPLGSAEDSYYRNTSFPYEAKDAPYEVMEELLFVKGMEKPVFQKLQEYLTVYGNGKVNINTASLPILFALGFTQDIAEKIITLRNGKDEQEGSQDDYIFTSPGDVVSGLSQQCNLSVNQIDQINTIVQQYAAVSSEHFLIKSAAVLNTKKNTARAICVANRKGQILRWKE